MSSPFDVPVREYASASLVSVPPETSLPRVQRLLDERGISAVPVVGPGGELRGLVSTTDLLRVARVEMASPGALARVWPPPREVGHVMHTDVATIDEDDPLREAGRRMAERRVHRLVVTRATRPIGVLSTRDALRAFVRHRVAAPLRAVLSGAAPITADVGESIDVAIARLADANVHGLVVVDGESPVGVFTHAEALKARALTAELRRTPVEQVMSYETIVLGPDTPLYRVAGHLAQTSVRRVLVVEGRALRAVATGFDVVRYMTQAA